MHQKARQFYMVTVEPNEIIKQSLSMQEGKEFTLHFKGEIYFNNILV